MIIETPIESLQEAISAEANGATQLELCARLDIDGLTPSEKLISDVLSNVTIPVKIMIRPHARSFIYSNEDIKMMVQSIQFAKEIGAQGVVFGALNENKELNIEQIKELTMISLPLQVTIHKAIDETPDPIEATKQLAKVSGIHTILSSGGKPTAEEGLHVLRRMMQHSGSIQIMAAGKITAKNMAEIHSKLGATAYHGRKILGEL